MKTAPSASRGLALLAAHVVLTLVMLPSERRLRADGGPGIVQFELAGTPARAAEILDQWGPAGQAAARRSLLLDHAYMASYAALGVWLVRAANAGRTATIARSAEALPVLAMGADFIEGRRLVDVLDGDLHRAGAARRAALLKFAALATAAVYASVMRLGDWARS